MAMSRSLALIVIASSCLLHAQDSTRMVNPPDLLVRASDRAMRIEAGIEFGANSIWNELPIALWQGGYVDRELRGRSRDGLRATNTAGYSIDVRLTYAGPLQGQWRPLISIAHHERMGVRFAPDLFNLTFFGNAAYEGRRADLGPARFAHFRYQTVGFGVLDARRDRMARVDLVIGQSVNKADVRWADLYTGTDGRVLRSNIRGDYLRSDTANSKGGAMNGIGLSFSGRWRLPLKPNPYGLVIALEVEDLGFCAWNGQSLRLERDTTIEFRGITVDNILELDEVVIGEEALLDTFGLRYRSGAITTWLPFTLRGRAQLPFDEHWTLSAIVEQRNLPGFVPQLSIGADRACGKRWNAGARLAMGGFGGLRLGCDALVMVGKRWMLHAGTPHLPAFFTGRTRGAGLWFGADLRL
jgi:hypothetical protein